MSTIVLMSFETVFLMVNLLLIVFLSSVISGLASTPVQESQKYQEILLCFETTTHSKRGSFVVTCVLIDFYPKCSVSKPKCYFKQIASICICYPSLYALTESEGDT